MELKFHHLKHRRPSTFYGSQVPRIKFKLESIRGSPGPLLTPLSLLPGPPVFPDITLLPTLPLLWQMPSPRMSYLPFSHIP